jgi:hypothetical protein
VYGPPKVPLAFNVKLFVEHGIIEDIDEMLTFDRVFVEIVIIVFVAQPPGKDADTVYVPPEVIA